MLIQAGVSLDDSIRWKKSIIGWFQWEYEWFLWGLIEWFVLDKIVIGVFNIRIIATLEYCYKIEIELLVLPVW